MEIPKEVPCGIYYIMLINRIESSQDDFYDWSGSEISIPAVWCFLFQISILSNMQASYTGSINISFNGATILLLLNDTADTIFSKDFWILQEISEYY